MNYRLYQSIHSLLEYTTSMSTITTSQHYQHGYSKRIGALAIKKGMMNYFDPHTGRRLPATVLYFDNTQVLGTHPTSVNQLLRIDVGCKDRKSSKKSHIIQRNYFKTCNVNCKQYIKGFLVSQDAAISPSTPIYAAHFVPGQYVDVQGTSIGKGFQGAMKRWGFKGLPASHGVSLTHRSIGSTGSRQDPGKVFKGKKMAGRMGGDLITVKRLQVLKVDMKYNCILLKGNVPGCDNGLIRIKDSKYNPTFAINPPPFPTFIGVPTGQHDLPPPILSKPNRTKETIIMG